MTEARSGRRRVAKPPRSDRTARSRSSGLRPVRIGSMDDAADGNPSSDRILLLRFEWETANGDTQPVLLALPERLD